jgi:hypothetical protein
MGALIQHGIYAKSERAAKARNQGVRRIMNQMLAIAPWLSDSDRPALRAWSALEWLTRRVMLVLSDPGLEREQQLNWSADYRALRATQNTIGNGLGLNAASRKQLAGVRLNLKTEKMPNPTNAEGGTRTRTGLAPQRILSPLCLPFHHPGIAHGQRIRWLGSHSSNHL